VYTPNVSTDELVSAASGNEQIPVLFCSDKRYTRYMAVAITSLLLNNPHRRFRLIVVLLDENPQDRRRVREVVGRFSNADLEFKEVSLPIMHDFPVNHHISLGAYVRLFLTDFLDTDIDKILYLDCDLLVCQDVSALWATDLGDHLLGAVPDVYSDNHVTLGFAEDEVYFNSGVLLVNVATWREESLQKSLIEYIRTHGDILRYHDQDALNAVARNRILALPHTWNFAARHADVAPEFLGMKRKEFLKIRKLPAILHYTSYNKPWIEEHDPHYRGIYQKYLALTPWPEERPSASPRFSFGEWKARRIRRTVTFLKWQFPLLGRVARRVTGLGDAHFHRK
jgi:lipopolysaccharide biosynthesis glycosyltransferase